MIPEAKGIARIKHSETGEIHEVLADDLSWNEVAADERGMGHEIQHEALIDHDELGEIAWRLWEYPEGAENDRETDVGGHELIDDLSYGLKD